MRALRAAPTPYARPATRWPPQELALVEPLPGCEPPKVEFRQLDLGSLASVRAFAKDFNRSGQPLHLLVCNAGECSWLRRSCRCHASGHHPLAHACALSGLSGSAQCACAPHTALHV